MNQWKCAMLGKPKQRDFFQLGSTAWLPRLPGRATRISFQDVPGFCVINYTNIGIDPKQGQQETKGKKTCTGMHQHEKKTARTSTSCLSVHAKKDAKMYQRAVHSSRSHLLCGCCCSKTLQIPAVYKHSWLKKS